MFFVQVSKAPRLLIASCCFAAIAALMSIDSISAQVNDESDRVAEEEFFTKQIQPIFIAKCYACHSEKVQKSSYRLDVREIAIAGGEFGEPPIVAGKSADSPLIRYVASTESDSRMPPTDSEVEPLTAEEVRLLQQWIDRGAVWPASASAQVADPRDWWSFKPLSKPAIPVARSAAIDYFISTKLAEHQLTMSPPADARALSRRLHFDLIGLPPTPESLVEFERAYALNPEDALDQLVEQLLASERYGERWARHWLDVVHYGDTHGFDKDKPRPNAWPYRDYVIRSFNTDKPYARFIAEQVAGDVLWPKTRDGMEALGFIAAGPWDFIGHAEVAETKIDGKIARHLDRDDMVSNVIGSFCSVTIHCAQCHQHKFDPITQEDYYSLQAVFAAVDRTDRPYYRDEGIQREASALEQQRTELTASFDAIETPLRDAAGEAYKSLTARIETASQPAKAPTLPAEFGYHSAIAAKQNEMKWVQVDLGARTEIQRVRLLPCYDDFNSIGAGFGFPVRFKIEVSDDAQFKSGVTLNLPASDETSALDFANPGLKPYEVAVSSSKEIAGRYVRVTATKLAPRQNDFIFALAELQIFNASGENIAQGRSVSALDSIEAPPRWRQSNLTDGIAPNAAIAGESKAQLIAAREQLLDSIADDETRASRSRLKRSLDDIHAKLKSLPAPDFVYAAGVHKGSGTFVGTGANGGKPRPIHLLARGQVTMPGAEVIPGALAAFSFQPARFPLQADASEGERRVALANWITDANNPLTWRSIVNRVWQYHFGRGIVDTPNDLGRNGGSPSHPELLDWLAVEFRDGGGSLKDLHRLIVKSATYRQASIVRDGAVQQSVKQSVREAGELKASEHRGARLDSHNVLLWRQNRRRLEAEAFRDSVLAVSGKLDLAMGGPGWQDFVIEHPEHSPHYEYGLADPEDAKTWRRSIYRFTVRSQTQPWMTSLDCADPSMRVDKRNESLSPIQALALLNNGFMLSQSKHFADRLRKERQSIGEQIERAYQLAIGSEPSESERAALIAFANQHGLEYACRVLLNLNAFTFVD